MGHDYPPVNVYSLLWKLAMEIVDLASHKMVDLSIVLLVYKRVINNQHMIIVIIISGWVYERYICSNGGF